MKNRSIDIKIHRAEKKIIKTKKKIVKFEKHIVKYHLLHTLIAAFAIGVLVLIFHLNARTAVVFGALASSAAAMIYNPTSRVNSLGLIISAYLIATAAGFFAWHLFMIYNLHIVFSAFLCVFITIIGFYHLDVFHPPAVGASLTFLLRPEASSFHLIYLLMGVIIVLVIIKSLEYFFDKELKFKNFHQEFLKHRKIEKNIPCPKCGNTPNQR